MIKDKQIDFLKKQIKKLNEENIELKSEIKSLNLRIENMMNTCKAAEKYEDELKHELFVLGEAKTKYELAYKELMRIKNEYIEKVNMILNEVKK